MGSERRTTATNPRPTRTVKINVTIEIKLIGFGDDVPPRFNGQKNLQIDIAGPASPRMLMQKAGIEEAADLILMNTHQVIPVEQWDELQIPDQSTLTILSAIEGG